MKRWLCLLVLLFAVTGAQAQNLVASGSLTAAAASCVQSGTGCTILGITSGSTGSAVITLAGTWTATPQFEASNDAGVTWAAIAGTPLAGGAAVTTSAANGTWGFNVSALTHIRVRLSAFVSGSVSVTITGSVAAASSRAGSSAGAVAWGAITGTLSNQTDLQTALNAKANLNITAGYLGPPGWMGGLLTASTTAITATANEMECFRLIQPFTIPVGHFSYMPITSAGVASNVGFAVYSSDGTTRLFTTGALDGTLVGKQTVAIAGSPTLTAGTAYLQCQTATTSATWATYAWGSSAAVLGNLFNTGNSSNIVKGANASVAGAPPATLGALTGILTIIPVTSFIEP